MERKSSLISCNPDCLGGPILKGDMKDDMKNLSDIQKFIVTSVLDNNKITIPELARKTGMSVSKINREIKILRDDFHIMKCVGGRKENNEEAIGLLGEGGWKIMMSGSS